jgi:hypothetical protein
VCYRLSFQSVYVNLLTYHIRFAKGEGAIVLVLKPLQDALRDNDHIYTVVSGGMVRIESTCLSVPRSLAHQSTTMVGEHPSMLHHLSASRNVS